LIDELFESFPINPWHGDVDAKTNQKQQTKGGKHPTAQPWVCDQLGDHFGGIGVASPTDEHVRKKKRLG
jgi:hypothetical protein